MATNSALCSSVLSIGAAAIVIFGEALGIKVCTRRHDFRKQVFFHARSWFEEAYREAYVVHHVREFQEINTLQLNFECYEVVKEASSGLALFS